MMKTTQIRCIGKVQGVFFRACTRDEAKKLGLKGYVQNESNGDVLIQVQGSDHNIERFTKWCQEGSPMSRVDKVEIEQMELDETFYHFDIRH